MTHVFPRFYYSDGSYSDLVPKSPRDIQAIVQKTEFDGTFMASGDDFYIFNNGEWIGVDLFGALDWMMVQGHLLAGRTIRNLNFSQVMKEALAYKNSKE